MGRAIFSVHPSRQSTHQAGFGLVELLVVLTITVSLALMTVPALQSITLDALAKQAQAELIAAARLTQSEALRRGQAVTLAARSDCQASNAVAHDWSCGWVVFVDSNADHVFDAINDPLVRSYSPLRQLPIRSNRAFAVYNPSGTTTHVQTLTIGERRQVFLSWTRIR